MTDWDDVDVEIDESRTAPPSSRWGWPLVLGAAVLAFALGFVWFFVLRRPQPPPNQASAPEQPVASRPAETPSRDEEPEPPLEIPSLDESDDLVRKLVEALSSHAELARWLVSEDLIRRFVVVVDNIAEGVSPASHLPFLDPEEEFEPIYRSGRFYIDRRSHERYDSVADVVDSVDATGTAKLYRDLKPLIEEAYAELGYPGGNFNDTLSLAIDRLMSVPVLEGEVELDGSTVSYKFADPALERLTPAQKHFLRMGPRNVKTIQAKLAELKSALRLPTVLSR